VPLTVFLLDYCIRYPTITLTDVAANELEVGASAVVTWHPCYAADSKLISHRAGS
jgi:hypothetical protein